MIYMNELIVLIMVYIILALSSSILIEFSGLLGFLPAALFGVAVFLYPLIFKLVGVHFIVVLIILLGITLLGLLIGLSSYKYNVSFLAVLTFGIIASHTTISLTPGAKLPILAGLLITFGAALVFTFLVYHLMNTPFAENLVLLKKNEQAVQLIGKSVSHLKLTSFVFSSFLAGVGGIMFSLGYTSTFKFDAFVFSMLLFAIILFGGQHILGTLLGVLVIGLIPELLSLTNLSGDTLLALKGIVFAGVICLFLFLKPEGLFTPIQIPIKKPKPKKIIIKLKKKETPRQKAKKVAKEKKLTKKQKKRQGQLKKISERLAEKHRQRDKKKKTKERKKLEKQLMKEKKKREKELARKKSYDALDVFESNIKKQEFRKEIVREKTLRGETLFEKGARFFREKGEDAVEYIKKKRRS